MSLLNNLTPDTFSQEGTCYELGMQFNSIYNGKIKAIRYYRAPQEDGIHRGKIWNSDGVLLASGTFTNETNQGWQQLDLSTGVNIQANTSYLVSVNCNTAYSYQAGGFDNSIQNSYLIAPVSAGKFNTTQDSFPDQTYNNNNYFVDVVYQNDSSSPTPQPTVTSTPQPTATPTLNCTETSTCKVVLLWDPVSTFTDGSPIPGAPDSVSYQIHVGTTSGIYTTAFPASSTTLTLDHFGTGTFYFVASAHYLDKSSGYSNEIFITFTPSLFTQSDTIVFYMQRDSRVIK